tara:strand:- start:679 stop:978 length:300 start_codon:yes stop_codon:yes gene_type:complete
MDRITYTLATEKRLAGDGDVEYIVYFTDPVDTRERQRFTEVGHSLKDVAELVKKRSHPRPYDSSKDAITTTKAPLIIKGVVREPLNLQDIVEFENFLGG